MSIKLPHYHQTVSVLLLGFLLLAAACQSGGKLPAKPSRQYNEVVRAFYIGLAALQVGDDVRADAKLAEVTQLVPPEPAGWANWGLLALRQRNFDAAAERLERARLLAPDNDQIYYLIGLLESSRGRSAEAVTALRKAYEINSHNLVATYKLAEEIERQGLESSEGEYHQLMIGMSAIEPDNLAILVEMARIGAKRGHVAVVEGSIAKLKEHSANWPPEVQQQLKAVPAVANKTEARQAATAITFLRNVLVRVPQYRMDLSKIKPPPGEEAVPFTHFLKLESPTFGPAAADMALNFAVAHDETTFYVEMQCNWAGAISLGVTGAPTLAAANASEVRLGSTARFAFPGGPTGTPPGPDGITPVDFSYDFKTDLVLAGAGGVRLMRQDSPQAFTDVTAQTKLSVGVTGANYLGSWAADIEADGDLDIVLGPPDAAPTVLRNNGDGTFLEIHPFSGISGLRGFAWADLDADGDPDAALIDGSRQLHVFSNERQGQFRERSLPDALPLVRAINVADINSDGVLDLLVVQADGLIARLSDKDEGQAWDTAEVARVNNGPNYLQGEFRLRVADLDNNGGLDLLLLTIGFGEKVDEIPRVLIWLGDEQGRLQPLEKAAPAMRVFDVADLNGDGRLDLVGLGGIEVRPMQAINHGTKNYHWQVVRPHASQASGDQRINPFGVGGEMELRAGLMLQKQPITGPLLHFGLGEQTSADVVRVVWPNGTVRAEFDVKADQEVVTEQRLKASCPFLFAYNGKRMEFLKDTAPWGSAIGLRINTLGSAKIAATGEWYKIGRDQLVPHDGYYDLRITAELWEVYYYDHLALMAVDHPAGTEIFVDERFVVPPLQLGFTTVATPRPIARATDDNGQDVTKLVNTLDGKALNTFGQGQYQGLTRDHYLEVDLGDDAPKNGPLYLIAHGSIHDTESSLNVAITQGERWKAHPLSLEVPDANGNWIVAQSNLGFPAGRKKTILFNLTNVFRPGAPRRVRIRTNLEIYWDQIEWAEGLPNASVKTVQLSPNFTDLHYRGYSVINKPDSGAPAPEVPDYAKLSATKQSWRDLIGYYTRHGDVTELLTKIDDRYVIMASGDELSLRFPEQPPPPAGWVRDYVFMGDGWIKDGDYNSTFSKTVLPLPYHAKQEYTAVPGALEDEWVYKQFPEDWQKYHTRYVSTDVFRNVLRPQKNK